MNYIVRSNPYFDSSNSNYAMCNGAQLFYVGGCVENRHVIHSMIGVLTLLVRYFFFYFCTKGPEYDSRKRTCSANPHIQSTLHNQIPTLRCAPAAHRQVPTTHFTQHPI